MTYRVLIVSADADDSSAMREMLVEALDGPFSSERVRSLADALTRLQDRGIDAVLLDLSLPDSQGIASFEQVFAAVPQTPIMTLCTPEDEALALQTLQRGAQGYLLKGRFASYLVAQSLGHIIQRRNVEANLFFERARAEITLNSISDAVISTDMQGAVEYLNVAAEQMTGWLRNEAQGQPIERVMNLVDVDSGAKVANPLELVLREHKPMGMKAGTVLIRRDGSHVAIEDSAAPIIDANQQASGAVIVFHDVTESRSRAMKMAHLAQHDFLTQLPNRVLLNDRIAKAIDLAERTGNAIALFFLDLDHFKSINDSLGHATGDKLLKAVAVRLSASVRNSDTVCRNGGDEFVVLLVEGRKMQDASVTAQKIISALAEPFILGPHEVQVSCSIGISVYPMDADNADTLLKNADMAMYHAKKAGRNNFQFFKHAMNVHADERQVIEKSLWQALQWQEFILHYQPKFNLETGAVTGAEALLRWQHPQWGVTLPEGFVKVAEACGLIVSIGRWVLREACRQTRHWQEQGLHLASIAVNISALEFRHPDFVAEVKTILSETGLEPGCLQLEITESILMRDAELSSGILQQLKGLGVQLAVDDYGTGYSSLSYLQKFPIDVLKIDKSFVHAIDTSNGVIASAMIAMGSSLQYKMVAEGVENQEQLLFLKSAQCEEGQGYLFSRGLLGEQFADLFLAKLPPAA